MRTAVLVALNELQRRVRDRSAVVTGIVAPLGLAIILGLAFGGRGTTALVRVAVVNEDQSTLGRSLVDGALVASSLPREVEVVRLGDEAAARAAVASRTVGAAVVVSAGAEARLLGDSASPSPSGQRAPLQVVERRDERVAGAVATAIEAAIVGRASAAQITAARAGALAGAAGSGREPGPTGRDELVTAVLDQPGAVRLVDGATAPRQGVIGYFGPSMAIIFLFLGAAAGARALLTERGAGTLARLQAAPVSGSAIIAGKVLAILVTGLVSILTVWAVTSAVFSASWGDPGAVLLLCLVTVIAMSGVSMLITVLARDPSQADMATTIVTFALALFGGNFFPPGSLPPSFERLTRLTPNGWALQGFGSLAIDGGHLGSVVAPLVVLGAIAVAFGGAAWLRLRAVGGALA